MWLSTELTRHVHNQIKLKFSNSNCKATNLCVILYSGVITRGSQPPQVATTSNEGDADVRAQLAEHSKILEGLKDIPLMLKALQEKMDQAAEAEASEEGILDDEQDQYSNEEHHGLLNQFSSSSDYDFDLKDNTANNSLQEVLKDSEDLVEYGNPLTDQIAERFQKCVTRPLSKQTSEKLKEKMKTPENCKLLAAPKVNGEIWNVLPNNIRNGDFKLQQMQIAMSQGLITLAKIADCVKSNNENGLIPSHVAEEILQLSVDGGNLIGMGFQEINSKRRQEIRPALNQEYSGICSQRFPVTEYLFGDDLNDNLRSSKAAANVVRRATSNKTRHSFKPYNKPAQTFKTRPNLNYTRPPPNQFRRGGLPFQASRMGLTTPANPQNKFPRKF